MASVHWINCRLLCASVRPSSTTHLHIISFKCTASHFQRITNRTIIINYCAVAMAFASVGSFEAYGRWRYVPDQTIWFFFFFYRFSPCCLTRRVVQPFLQIPNASIFPTCQSNTDRRCEFTESRKVVSNSQKRIYFQTKRILDILWFIMQSLKLPKTTSDVVDEDDKKKKTWMRLEKGTALSAPAGGDCKIFFFFLRPMYARLPATICIH